MTIGAVVSLIVMQAIYVFKFFHFMNSASRNGKISGKISDKSSGKSLDPSSEVQPDYQPHVGIVLCLRGDDPSLKSCIESLLQQTYPDFEILFILDDRQDPALVTLEQCLQSADASVQTSTIFLSHEVAKTCSLKNQAVITAVTHSNEAIEVFALVDADGVIEPTWLTDLVAPLAQSDVGVTTGNRWFEPDSGNLGSKVRKAWNAASLPQMSLYNIAWGGSLAIKRSTIVDCNLLDHWSNGFCEDTMLAGLLSGQNLRVVRVPKVIVINREATTLSAAMNWISRQLLTVRLHHKSWPLVLIHAIFSLLCLIGLIISIVWLAIDRNYFELGRVGLVLFAFLISNIALLNVIQVAIAFALRKEGSNSDESGPPIRIGKTGGALITQLLYPFAAIKTALMRKVHWRGITYKIRPGKTITMEEYRPYRECIKTEPSANTSID